MSQPYMTSGKHWIELYRTAIRCYCFVWLSSHREGRTQIIMCQRVVGVDGNRFSQDVDRFFVKVHLLQNGSKVMPCGAVTGGRLGNLFKKLSRVAEAAGLNR